MKTILVFLCLALALTFAACGGKSDADLKTAVENQLKTDNVTGLTVDVKDGVATLKGEVADQAAMDKVKALKVEGVKEIKTADVKVKPTPVPQMASGNDTEVKTKIEENWKKAGCTGASVVVKDGTATGTGTVPKGKLATCVQAAQEAKPGKFDNKLAEAK
jgi:hyperosmotically inducible protein